MLNTNKEEQKEISPDKGSRQSFSRLSSGLKKPQIADINYTKAAMNGAKRRKSEMKPKSTSVIDSDRQMKMT